jgi:hypothetical protein
MRRPVDQADERTGKQLDNTPARFVVDRDQHSIKKEKKE